MRGPEILGWIALLSQLVKGRRAKRLLAAAPLGIELRERFRVALQNGTGFEMSAGEVAQLGNIADL
jgi:hypothetical protein